MTPLITHLYHHPFMHLQEIYKPFTFGLISQVQWLPMALHVVSGDSIDS